MVRFLLIFFFLFSNQLFTQNIFKGKIISSSGLSLKDVEIYDKDFSFLLKSNNEGLFNISSNENSIDLFFVYEGYTTKQIIIQDSSYQIIKLSPLLISLENVEVMVSNFESFNMRKLDDIEKMSVYSGRKTEVIKVNQAIASLATNNARQIYNQVSGLNVFQNDDAGLQLNVGGRGLDPNRTSNFNTRQNNYDISADVLGYPESYYTPPVEALEEIQIVRGAASLQYGTQFGGLLNFVFKAPKTKKPIELISRNSIGSNNLFTNFTSLSGTLNKFSYYTFVNYKKGNGFRPNSNFNSINLYSFWKYSFNDKLNITSEITYINYLTQQAGGLTDQMFSNNILQSNRSRNWFEVNWLLFNTKLLYRLTEKTKFSLSLYGLDAGRNSIGYRTNRVNQADLGGVRDLIKGDFRNSGIESKILHRYKLFDKSTAFVFGFKYYRSKNKSSQGPGSDNNDADFEFYTSDFQYYKNQSEYNFPNLNNSFFIENLFYVNDKLSITPGLRYEFIKT